MTLRNIYSRVADVIANARDVAHAAGDTEFESKLRDLEIMTLDRLYIAMDGIESGSHQAANRKQGRMKTRRAAHLSR